MESTGVPLGHKLVSTYFDLFKQRAKHLLFMASREDDEDVIVSNVLDSKDLRSVLDNFAVVVKSRASHTVESIVLWRQKQAAATAAGAKVTLAADTLMARAAMHVLLHNDTWQHHWRTRKDTGVTLITPEAAEGLEKLLIARVSYWLADTAQSEGRKRVADILLEVLAVLSKRRFCTLATTQANTILQNLTDELQGKVEKEVNLSLRLLKGVRFPLLPADPEAEAARLRCLTALSQTADKTHKNKGLKRLLCEVLCSLVAPLAASGLGGGLDSDCHVLLQNILQKARRWGRKDKYILAALPLQTAILCISPRPCFTDQFEGHFSSILKRLPDDKDRRMRCLLLDSLLHLLGTYLLFNEDRPLPTTPPKYIPPPLKEGPRRTEPTAPPKDPLTCEPELREDMADAVRRVFQTIAAITRKQPLTCNMPAFRQYSITVDLLMLALRLHPSVGVPLLLSLAPPTQETKDVISEGTLCFLYPLLLLAILANHHHPQGAVEEHGVSQGAPLSWWTIGTPSWRTSEGLPIKIRSPFTSLRPPSPVAALLADKAFVPILSGMWGASPPALILDTSTLCTFSVQPPQNFYAALCANTPELIVHVTNVLQVCERELARAPPRRGDTLSSEREKATLHLLRVSILATVYILPSMSGKDYFSLLARLSIHHHVELRDTVCNTVLPQLLLLRPTHRTALLTALVDILTDDTAPPLLITFIRLLRLWHAASDPSRHATLPAPAAALIARPFHGIGDLSGTPQDSPWARLEASCLNFLTLPNTEIRIKALVVLRWVARVAPLSGSTETRVVTVLENSIECVEARIAEVAVKSTPKGGGHVRKSSQLDERDNGRGMLSPAPDRASPAPRKDDEGEEDEASSPTVPPTEAPEALRQLVHEAMGGVGTDAPHIPYHPLQLSAPAVDIHPWLRLCGLALFSAHWAYLLAGIIEATHRHSPAAALCHKLVATKIGTAYSRVLEASKPDPAGQEERRQSLEFWKCTLMVYIALARLDGAESPASILTTLTSLIRSPTVGIAEAGCMAFEFLPKAFTQLAVEHLQAVDEECRQLGKKDKARKNVVQLRCYVIRSLNRVLNQARMPVDPITTSRVLDVLDGQYDAMNEKGVDWRWRVDVLELTCLVCRITHTHSASNRCSCTIDLGRRRKWMATTILLSGRLKNDENADSELAKHTLPKARAATAALLAGPLVAVPVLDWVEMCAAGRASPEYPEGTTITFASLLTYIHQLILLPPTAAPDANLAAVSLDTLLGCNPTNVLLLRSTAILAFHRFSNIASLHLRALARATASGVDLPPQALPLVLTAVVGSLNDPSDRELRDAAWELLPAVAQLGSPPDTSPHCPPRADGAIAHLAEAIPEAGPRLLSIARARIPHLPFTRQASLLRVLPHWARHLPLDTPPDIDELLLLTEAHAAAFPEVFQRLWEGLEPAALSSIQLQIVQMAVKFVAGEGQMPWELSLTFMPAVAVQSMFTHLVDLLDPESTEHPSVPYEVRVPAGLLLMGATIPLGTPEVFKDAAAIIVHAAVTVGANHTMPSVAHASRGTLAALLQTVHVSEAVTTARARVRDILDLWKGAVVPFPPHVTAVLIAAQPCGVASIRSAWAAAALTHLCSKAVPVDLRRHALDLYMTTAKCLQGDLHPLMRCVADSLPHHSDLAAAVLQALVPVVERWSSQGSYGDSLVFLLRCSLVLVRAADVPPVVSAAAAVAVGCLQGMPPTGIPPEGGVGALQAILPQLYTGPTETHDALVTLVVALATSPHRSLLFGTHPSANYSSSLLLAALLPEICAHFQRHAQPGGTLAALSSSIKGTLGSALRQRDHSQATAPTDFLCRVSDVLAEQLWRTTEYCDAEVGEFYLYLIHNAHRLHDGILGWLLRCVAHLLLSPSMARVGSSHTSLAPLLAYLPSLTVGSAQSFAAHCLSLALLHDKGTAKASKRPSTPPLLLPPDKCTVSAMRGTLMNVLHSYSRHRPRNPLRVEDDEGVEIMSLASRQLVVDPPLPCPPSARQTCIGTSDDLPGSFNYYITDPLLDHKDHVAENREARTSSTRRRAASTSSTSPTVSSPTSAKSRGQTAEGLWGQYEWEPSDLTLPIEAAAVKCPEVAHACAVHCDRSVVLIVHSEHPAPDLLTKVQDVVSPYTESLQARVVISTHLRWTYTNGLLAKDGGVRRSAVLFRHRHCIAP